MNQFLLGSHHNHLGPKFDTFFRELKDFIEDKKDVQSSGSSNSSHVHPLNAAVPIEGPDRPNNSTVPGAAISRNFSAHQERTADTTRILMFLVMLVISYFMYLLPNGFANE